MWALTRSTMISIVIWGGSLLEMLSGCVFLPGSHLEIVSGCELLPRSHLETFSGCFRLWTSHLEPISRCELSVVFSYHVQTAALAQWLIPL
jgi:hypothetical protein